MSGFREVTIGDCRLSAKPIIVYALCDPVSGEPRYVGKTNAPRASYRYRGHKYDAKHKRASDRWSIRWLNKLYRAGLEPKIVEIQTIPPGGNWAAAERRWIRRLRERGFALTNLTAGGDGIDGWHHTEDARQKIAAARRTGRWCNCSRCGVSVWRSPHAIAARNYCSRLCANKHQRELKRAC